jgi:MoaA/NifB/PqqE/SkfB family radical SAM enzyme
MAKAGVKIVKFTGGEPLLRQDIFQLAERVKRHGMYLSMISNGSARPQAYRDLIRIGLDAITISVDGTREMHDHVRGMKGSFDKAITAIQVIAEEKKTRGITKPSLEVSCAISALTQSDVENVASYFQDFEIDWLNFGYLHFSSSDRQKATEAEMSAGKVMHLKNAELPTSVVAVDTAALARRVAAIKASREQLKVPVKFTPDLKSEEIGLQYADNTTFTFTDKCFYAWYATRVDPWGQMYPCWLDVRLGDVRERPFMELWNGQQYRSFRRVIRKNKVLPKCATCCILNDKLWSRLPTFHN